MYFILKYFGIWKINNGTLTKGHNNLMCFFFFLFTEQVIYNVNEDVSIHFLVEVNLLYSAKKLWEDEHENRTQEQESTQRL